MPSPYMLFNMALSLLGLAIAGYDFFIGFGLSSLFILMMFLSAAILYFLNQSESSGILIICAVLALVEQFLIVPVDAPLKLLLWLMWLNVLVSRYLSFPFLILLVAFECLVSLGMQSVLRFAYFELGILLFITIAGRVIGILISKIAEIFDKFRKAEQSLQFEESRSRLLEECSDTLFLDIHWAGKNYCSSGLEVFASEFIDNSDMLFNWLKACISIEDKSLFEKEIERSIAIEGSINILVSLSLQGSKRQYRMQLFAQKARMPGHRYERVTIAMKDVSLQKEALLEANRYERVLKFVQSSAEFQFVTLQFSHERHKILAVQGDLYSIFGIHSIEFIGEPIWGLSGWEPFAEDQLARINLAVSARQPLYFEHTFINKTTGISHALMIALSPRSEQLDASECIIVDITARAKLTDQVELLSRNLSAAQSSTLAFLTLLNREIMVPLDSLSSHMQIAQSLSQEKPVRNQLSSAMTVFKTLKSLIQDSVTLGEINLLHMKPSNEGFSLGEFVLEFQQKIHQSFAGRPVILDLTVDPKLPDRVISDKIRLRQILMRIVAYCSLVTRRGKLVVSIEQGEVDFDKKALQVNFKIQDTSKGYAAEGLKRLTRRDSIEVLSSSKHVADPVASLLLMKHQANLIGGDLSIESIQGEGNIFNLSIYLEPEISPDLVTAIYTIKSKEEQRLLEFDDLQADKRLSTKKILVVDVNPLNCESLKMLLDLEGASVDVVMSAATALQKLADKNHGYHAVISDVVMPKKSGFEMAKDIRAMSFNSKLPILFITANYDDYMKSNYLKAGGDLLLTKPFNSEQLLSPLLKLLKGEKFNRPSSVDMIDQSLRSDDEVLNITNALANLGSSRNIYRTMVERFLVRIHTDIDSLLSAIKDGDSSMIIERAHFISGSAMIVGAVALDRWLKKIEAKVLAEETLDNPQKDIDELKAIMHDTLAALTQVKLGIANEE